jgi:hypothetical protein
MSGSKRRPNRNRSTAAKVRPDPVTFWREDEPVLEPPLLRRPIYPSATLKSIGDPPVSLSSEAGRQILVAAMFASEQVIAFARARDLLEDEPAAGTD